MRLRLFPAGNLLGCMALLALLTSIALLSQAAEGPKYQILLVWATDDAKPPAGKDYKPVEPEIRKQIKALKWKNYFEVKRIDFSLPPGSLKKVPISEKCELDVKDLGNSSLEVVLFGKGKEVARVKQVLRKGEILVPAGDAPNETAWLAILKRLE
jgi:hypothetical protein